MKRLFTIIFLFLTAFYFPINASAAPFPKDSLENIVNDAKISDENKLKPLLLLSQYLVSIDIDLALKYAQQSFVIAKKTKKQSEIGEANRVLGVAYRVKSELTLSLKHLIEAENIFTALADSFALAKTNLHIGTYYKVVNDFNKAHFYYEKARFTIEKGLEIKPNEDAFYDVFVELNRNESELAMLQDDADKAIYFIQKTIEIDLKKGKKDNIAQSLMGMGVIWEKKKDYTKAYKSYTEALTEKLKSPKKSALPLYYLYAGNMASKLQKYAEAEDFLKKGLEIAQASHTTSVITFANTLLSEHYTRTQSFELALKHFKTAVSIKDSIFTKEKSESLSKIQSNYELEKKQAQIDLLDKDKKISQLVMYGLILLIALFLLIFLAGAFFYAKNSKKNDLLKKQNEAIIIKNAMLEQQQEEINAQTESVKILNSELNLQKNAVEEKNRLVEISLKKVEEKNKQVIDSIRYAQQIQAAALPFYDRIKKSLPESFIIYRPKNIVSGDFYWFTSKKDKIYIAAADCTGHGVPGAFMSLIGMNFLSSVINEKNIETADKILEELDRSIKIALRQDEKQNSDGIAIGICVFDRAQLRMHYAGANNTLYFADENELYQIKGDKQSVGGYRKNKEGGKIFTAHEVPLRKTNHFYMTSDGFQDQIGGGTHKRFTSTNLKMLLLDAAEKPIEEQKAFLEDKFIEWQGEETQTDDVLLFGFKVRI